MASNVAAWFAKGGAHHVYYMYYGGNHIENWAASGLTNRFCFTREGVVAHFCRTTQAVHPLHVPRHLIVPTFPLLFGLQCRLRRPHARNSLVRVLTLI
jgi:hypothetical protein